MADRITQLQDALNQLADQFCNSIGILQQSAKPGQFPGFERSTTIDDKSIQQGYRTMIRDSNRPLAQVIRAHDLGYPTRKNKLHIMALFRTTQSWSLWLSSTPIHAVYDFD
ncbi:uncharacterized protein LOC116290356 isoform X3 [Actinia tenebrosa]|uniref:Mediator of RNA polymerase II transcription subunit 21 n=1 Tax=Actinia tenebrosa TaxID=6105 RepID=A0A6P8HDV1_ACTTE|nr:uncharacterized protein LOC116290356 isoform X3 [Actinia tenebrosa]